MKTYLIPGYCLMAIIGMAACSNPIKNDSVQYDDPLNDGVEKTIAPAQVANTNTTVLATADLVGFWVGWFKADDTLNNTDPVTGWDYANKITLSIDSIGGGTVVGHSIVAGNSRPFRGTYKEDANAYTFMTVEPGDDKYDGTFSFSIPKSDSLINGHWKAYKELKVSKRKYQLRKRIFRYDPAQAMEFEYVDWSKFKDKKINDGQEVYYSTSYFTTTAAIYSINPSVQLLDARDVEKLTKADIFVLRNSIYAKHGYSFRNRQLRTYFDQQEWYMPVHTDIKEALSTLELANIELFMRYEKHAEEYYDEFGR